MISRYICLVDTHTQFYMYKMFTEKTLIDLVMYSQCLTSSIPSSIYGTASKRIAQSFRSACSNGANWLARKGASFPHCQLSCGILVVDLTLLYLIHIFKVQRCLGGFDCPGGRWAAGDADSPVSGDLQPSAHGHTFRNGQQSWLWSRGGH